MPLRSLSKTANARLRDPLSNNDLGTSRVSLVHKGGDQVDLKNMSVNAFDVFYKFALFGVFEEKVEKCTWIELFPFLKQVGDEKLLQSFGKHILSLNVVNKEKNHAFEDKAWIDMKKACMKICQQSKLYSQIQQ